MRPIRQSLRTLTRATDRAFRIWFAPYAAMDDNGTFLLFYREASARAWLPYLCPQSARVLCWGRTIARRVQG